MKKSILISLLAVILFSCKTSQSTVNTKLDNKSEVAIKGNWIVTSVDFPSSEYLAVTSFNVADSKCFVGSQWSFISNNNKGQMKLYQSNCVDYESQITWYINRDGFMAIKFLTEGIKAKHTEIGYALKVANITEDSFQLIDKVNIAGKISDLTYTFKRLQ